MLKRFKYDEMSNAEASILDKIEEENNYLISAKINGFISDDFYNSIKVRLLKSLVNCRLKFNRVYKYEKGC